MVTALPETVLDLEAQVGPGVPVRPVDVGTRPQLFVDGYLVARSEGLTERLHQVIKHPQPVLTSTAPWENPDRSGLSGVYALYDTEDKLFKLWYNTAPHHPGRPRYSCYATSPDGVNFERPFLINSINHLFK